MLLQIKIYLIAISYFLGALFMVLFAPRNFEPSGAKLRMTRSVGDDIQFKPYADQKMVRSAVERFQYHNPEVVNMVRLTPLTSENNTILAVELRSDRQTRKPGILIIGALNPMAWGAPNVILELSEKLLYDASYQTPFFNDYDWYLIPLANPDGVEFTHKIHSRPPLVYEEWVRNETMRLHTRPAQWHKNVDKEAKEKNPACFGTNINRNFAYHWQDDVHKAPPRCCQYYPGPKPFSTAEAKTIRNYLDKLGDDINLAIHLHASFSPKKEYILYPWRYSMRTPSNYHTLQDIGEYAARQARLPDGRLYEVHQSSHDERVAGTLCDYVSGVVGIDLVYLIKPYHQMFPNFTDPRNLDDMVITYTGRNWNEANDNAEKGFNVVTIVFIGQVCSRQTSWPPPEVGYNGCAIIIHDTFIQKQHRFVPCFMESQLQGGTEVWRALYLGIEIDVYVSKSIATILSVIRGWRSSTKQNTLSFFGRDVEF